MMPRNEVFRYKTRRCHPNNVYWEVEKYVGSGWEFVDSTNLEKGYVLLKFKKQMEY